MSNVSDWTNYKNWVIILLTKPLLCTFQFRQPQPKYKTTTRTENGNGSSNSLHISNNINYGTGMGHLALCVVSGWAIHQMQFDQSPLSLCCFTFLIGHSLLGVLRFTHPSVSECIMKSYQMTTLLAQTLPLLLVTTQLCINVRLFMKYIYIQILFALLPTVCDLSNKYRYRDYTLNIIVMVDALLLGYAGFYKEKFWSTGLAVLSVLNHFSVKHICGWYSVPRTDLVVVGLAFFTIFAVNCLNEWKIIESEFIYRASVCYIYKLPACKNLFLRRKSVPK